MKTIEHAKEALEETKKNHQEKLQALIKLHEAAEKRRARRGFLAMTNPEILTATREEHEASYAVKYATYELACAEAGKELPMPEELKAHRDNT